MQSIATSSRFPGCSNSSHADDSGTIPRSAPREIASSIRSGAISNAMTSAAPWARTAWTAISPAGPRPEMPTRLPFRSPAFTSAEARQVRSSVSAIRFHGISAG